MVQMERSQVLVLVFGNIAWMLPLWLWNRSESRADQRQMTSLMQGMQNQIIAIHQEMKDFHRRLERIDEEFKGKLALQDADFKAHIIHYHKD